MGVPGNRLWQLAESLQELRREIVAPHDLVFVESPASPERARNHWIRGPIIRVSASARRAKLGHGNANSLVTLF